MMLQNIKITAAEYSAEVDGKRYTVPFKTIPECIEAIRVLVNAPPPPVADPAEVKLHAKSLAAKAERVLKHPTVDTPPKADDKLV